VEVPAPIPLPPPVVAQTAPAETSAVAPIPAGRRLTPPPPDRIPPPRSAVAQRPIPTVPLVVTPPQPDSLPGATGLWAFATGTNPADDATLYYLASGWWSRETIRREGLLKPEIQAREDSIPLRLFVPRFTGVKRQELVSAQVAAQLDSGTVEVWTELRETIVGARVRLRQDDYLRRLTRKTYREQTVVEAARGLKANLTASSRRGLVKIDLPVELPARLQSVFGEGKPNLSVRGSERISFAGTSRWRPKEIRTEIARKQSKFPQLDMKQELNLQLTGTIGDKVSVDVDQSSQASTPLSNRIKIHYKGYEDEILQRVDLGNTSLSLPGTQYVSYGGKAEGLFGINAQARLGPVEITTILTKQEGKTDSKSVTRSAETRTVKIIDLDYVAGKYFFLLSPDSCLWQLDEASLDVFVDDGIGTNDEIDGAAAARATVTGAVEADSTTYRGSFRRLIPGDPPAGEYRIERQIYTGHPVLVLNRAIEEREVLAVLCSGWRLDASLQRVESSFFEVGRATPGDSLQLKVVRPSLSDPRVDLTNLRRGPWAPLSNLELRNIYDLGARGILKEGFDCKIRLQKTISGVQPDRVGDITFLQMTGLDLSRETSTGQMPGRDDRIDPQFISLASGTIMFPDLRPFDPDAIDLGIKPVSCLPAFYRFLKWGEGDNIREARPAALPGITNPDSAATFRAPSIYDRILHQDPQADSRYFIEVTYRSPVSRIQLNAFGILLGSESVTAGQRALVRDRDYRIDYEMGEVELLEAANVTEQEEIRVTYSYEGFGGGGGSKTLAGASAFLRPEGAAFSGSSSWLYESKGGVPGLEGKRPRLGQEPSRTVVGELAGAWKTDSKFLTNMVDQLPGIDARLPSKLDIGFGAGFSLPNPNTKGKLYIDDFDGVKDVLSLSMSRRMWRPASIPISSILPGSNLPPSAARDSLRAAAQGDLRWFSPRNTARESDFQPTLETREGDDSRQILQMRVSPRGTTPQEKKSSWAGIVQVLSARGTDLSRAQFLDVWVNDRRQYRPHPDPSQQRRGTLIIDIGTVNEDAMWYRNNPAYPEQYTLHRPNGKLDTEDQNRDGRLDQGSNLDEDTGLDQKKSGITGADPFDVYRYDDNLPETDPDKYASVNGTEGNQELDTEDLNGNGALDRLNSYFQVAIDLADSTLWETDVYRDYVFKNSNAKPDLVKPENGWRRIRIPLHDDSLVSRWKDFEAASPVWEKVFHLRMWVTGFEEPTDLEIGGIEITGNRWFENAIADTLDRSVPEGSLAPGEEFFVGVVNNKEDANVYVPPVSTGKQDNITEREQSIALNVKNFKRWHRVSIYRSYPQRQDYTLYENMEFYLKHGALTDTLLRPINPGDDSLECAIRLCRDAGSDTTNYYEYRRPVSAAWDLVRIDFAELSRLQLVESPDPAIQRVERNLGGGVWMTRQGSPSLTSIQRIVFLVTNRGNVIGKGSVWVNELRLIGVKKDPGYAARFSINADLTGLARLSFNIQRTEADFLKIGQDRGSGTTSTNWNFNGSTELFGYASRLGVTMPISGSITSTRAVPKFRTNSDLILDRAEDRDISVNRTQDLSLSLSKRPGRTWLGRYIVEPFSANASYRTAVSLQPTQCDTTVNRSAGVSWSLPLDQIGQKIGLRLNKSGQTKLLLIPTSLSASLAGGEARAIRYSATNNLRPYVKQPSSSTRSGTLNISAGARPITPVIYRIDTSRDLMLHEDQLNWLGLNLGREVSRKHQLNGTFPLPVLRQLLGPSVNWSGSSSLTLAKQGQGGSGTNEPSRENDFGNSRSTGYVARFSPDVLGRWFGRIVRSRARPDSTGAKTAAPTSTGSLVGQRFRFNTVNMNYSVANQTSFTRQTGEPDILYQLALADKPGARVRALSRASDKKGTSKSLTLDSNAQLPAGVTVTARYSRTAGTNSDNGLAVKNLTSKWPDLSVNWGNAFQKLRLNRFFKTFQGTTNYNREYREQGKAQGERDQVTRSSNFTPFLNLSASTRSGITTTFSSSNRSSSTELFRPTRSISSTRNRQLGFGLKKTLNLTRKVTVPLTGQMKTVQTTLNVNVDFDWKADRSENRSAGQRPTIMTDMASWRFQTGVGYQFTAAISGNGSINFGQESNKKNQALTARFIGISVSASFTF
jgi:hypothetical protein